MAGERDMSRVMRQMFHKKQERTQTIQSTEPRIEDLKEGIPEFRNVKDRGVVQYVKYRDEIYSIVMEKEGLADGIDEGAVDTSGRIDGSLEQTVGTSGLSANDGWQTLAGGLIIQWGIVTSDSTVTFPKVFNGTCFGVYLGKITSDSSIPRVTAITTTNFAYSSSDIADGDAYWIALGN